VRPDEIVGKPLSENEFPAEAHTNAFRR
jgi:hypothetical protein